MKRVCCCTLVIVFTLGFLSKPSVCGEFLAPHSQISNEAEAAQKIAELSAEHRKIFRVLRLADVYKQVPHPYYFPLGEHLLRVTLPGQPAPEDGLGEPLYQIETLDEVFSYFSIKEWGLIRTFLMAYASQGHMPPEIPKVYYIKQQQTPTDLALYRERMQERNLLRDIQARDRNAVEAMARIRSLGEILRGTPSRKIAIAAYERLVDYVDAMKERQRAARERFAASSQVPSLFEWDGATYLGLEALMLIRDLEGDGKVPSMGQDYAVDRLDLYYHDLQEELLFLERNENVMALDYAYEHIEWDGHVRIAPYARRDLGELKNVMADPLVRLLHAKKTWENSMRKKAGEKGLDMLQKNYASELNQLELCRWIGSGVYALHKYRAFQHDVLLLWASRGSLIEMLKGYFELWKIRSEETYVVLLRELFQTAVKFYDRSHDHLDVFDEYEKFLYDVSALVLADEQRLLPLLQQIKADPELKKNPKQIRLFSDLYEVLTPKINIREGGSADMLLHAPRQPMPCCNACCGRM